ncbi:MAG: 4Fe-4S binding protein [candidate division WOR-3 bacterium]|jgi:polyferredoxin
MTKRRIAPHRIGQIIGTVILNGYILAYLQNKILYSGFLKSVPEPVLNCYGGPLSVFACPLGSFQQIIGMKGVAWWQNVPWVVLGVFFIVGAFTGRAACGWICPFGLWQDLLFKIKTGPRARLKRWLSFGIIALIGLLAVSLLTIFLKIVFWKGLLFGWVPFMTLMIYSTIRGKTELPARFSIGGLLLGLLLGILIILKYEVNIGIATGVVGMTLFSLLGAGPGLFIAVPAGFILSLFGKPLALGPFAGTEIGMLFTLMALLIFILLERGLKLYLPATGLKYAFLILVAGITAYLTAEPWFCKLCPQGTLEAGIPLVLWDPVQGLRALVGWLFYLKVAILLFVLWSSIMVKRPFCRTVCPIGAVYALFNKASLLRLKLDSAVCDRCGRCRRVCPTDIEPYNDPNQAECIRCFECVWHCPHQALKITI